jgi:hypothetical protein
MRLMSPLAGITQAANATRGTGAPSWMILTKIVGTLLLF